MGSDLQVPETTLVRYLTCTGTGGSSPGQSTIGGTGGRSFLTQNVVGVDKVLLCTLLFNLVLYIVRASEKV